MQELGKVKVMLCAIMWYLSLMSAMYFYYELYWYCAASSLMAVLRAWPTDNLMQQALSLAIVAVSACTCTVYTARAMLWVKVLMGAQLMHLCFIMGKSVPVNNSEVSRAGRIIWASS